MFVGHSSNLTNFDNCGVSVIYDRAAQAVRALFEYEFIEGFTPIPMGSSNKYEFDKKTGLLKLDRVLYSAVHYPANYGFIPQTLGEDGDPLDVLVLGSTPVVPRALVVARPIGLISITDREQADHKVIAVHANDREFDGYQQTNDLPRHRLAVIKRFFEDYKALEDKKVVVNDILPAERALQLVEQCVSAYRKHFRGVKAHEH
jgi:inorganic pyrophosphatase